MLRSLGLASLAVVVFIACLLRILFGLAIYIIAFGVVALMFKEMF